MNNGFSHQDMVPDSACINREMMLRYLQDDLLIAEKHKVERHLEECPFCTEALEGLQLLDESKAHAILSEINKNIDIITHDVRQERGGMPAYFKYAAAAVLLVLVAASYFVTTQLMDDNDTRMAQQHDELTKREQQATTVTDYGKPIAQYGLSDADLAAMAAVDTTEEAIEEELPEEEMAMIAEAPAATKKATAKKEQAAEQKKKAARERQQTAAPMADGPGENDLQQLAPQESYANFFERPQPPAATEDAGAGRMQDEEQTESLSVGAAKMAHTPPSKFDEGMAEFNRGNKKGYKNAVSLFSEALQQQPNSVPAQYYLGVSHFKLGDHKLALPHLNKAINSGSPSIAANAKYYKARILIGQMNMAQARTLLQQIRTRQQPEAPSADDLLKQLGEE